MAPRDTFNQDMARLEKNTADMCEMVEQALRDTCNALQNDDLALAEKVLAGEEDINHMENKLEHMCLGLLTRQSPFAGALRKITSVMKIIIDLERIGDQCEDICEIIINKHETEDNTQLALLPQMFEKAHDMFSRSVESFLNSDTEGAHKVIADDDEVDAMFMDALHELADMIGKDPTIAISAVHLMMIAKYLERIADHATNIAEWGIYLSTGVYPYDQD